ncbi:hypothetical protein ACJBU6_07093 [Exserohilum turcicum]
MCFYPYCYCIGALLCRLLGQLRFHYTLVADLVRSSLAVGRVHAAHARRGLFGLSMYPLTLHRRLAAAAAAAAVVVVVVVLVLVLVLLCLSLDPPVAV